ncbi:MAG: EamA family transporter [Clostridiaceae bacterium]|nr:EamA family transporter [Clostridiaceae bacterium]
MYKYLLVCLIMTIFGAFGGLFFKRAADTGTSIINIFFSPYLYLGGTLYVISAALNILALKGLNYTVVLPITAITYVWTLVISFFILKEKLSSKKISGVILIIVGALILGLSK